MCAVLTPCVLLSAAAHARRHVSGTIGAIGNNGLGVSGVCQSGIKIIPLKFIGPNGGTLDGAIAALNYVLDLKTRHGLNLVATSNSWGGGGYTSLLEAAIARHRDANVLFIAAAGNCECLQRSCAGQRCPLAVDGAGRILALSETASTKTLLGWQGSCTGMSPASNTTCVV